MFSRFITSSRSSIRFAPQHARAWDELARLHHKGRRLNEATRAAALAGDAATLEGARRSLAASDPSMVECLERLLEGSHSAS